MNQKEMIPWIILSIFLLGGIHEVNELNATIKAQKARIDDCGGYIITANTRIRQENSDVANAQDSIYSPIVLRERISEIVQQQEVPNPCY
jgi:hypothetical protein